MSLERPAFSIYPDGGGFAVRRNGKALESPLHFPLVVPTRALAEEIVREFAAQGEKTDLRKMPLTQMALTSIDITAQNRANILGSLMRYGETELVCQRATDPADLVDEQNRVWHPYLDWCQKEFGGDLRVGSGIVPFDQNKSALAAMQKYVETLDSFFLTGLGEACHTLGSLVLGLALMKGRAGVAEAFAAAELDSLWQSKKWGEDPVTQNRHADIRRDLEACVRWFALLLK